MEGNNRIKIVCVAGILILLAIFAGIKIRGNKVDSSISIIGGADGPTAVFVAGKLPGKESKEYMMITMEEAKEIFATEGDYIILDVRRPDEFAEGHIPGAINVANEDISDTDIDELPDKDQLIYVYCRSGRRSKEAAGKLAAMGYSNVVECGGINDWTGDIE